MELLKNFEKAQISKGKERKRTIPDLKNLHSHTYFFITIATVWKAAIRKQRALVIRKQQSRAFQEAVVLSKFSFYFAAVTISIARGAGPKANRFCGNIQIAKKGLVPFSSPSIPDKLRITLF